MTEERFPNPGTDRRPDELERSLQAETAATTSLERAIETDRVADVDRVDSVDRALRNRRLIDLLAVAVLILFVLSIVLGTLLITR